MATLEYVKNKSIDTTIKKYDILLMFLNALLTKMGKHQITDVLDFKLIRRDELLTQENEDIIEEHKDLIHAFYSKHNTKYLQKKSVKNYLLTFLKALTNELNLDLGSTTIITRVSKTQTKTSVMYSVEIPFENEKEEV